MRVVTLVGTPDRRDGTWLRVTQFGAWTADVGSVAELERFFPLSDLEPDDGSLAAEAASGSAACAVSMLATAARRTHPCLCPSYRERAPWRDGGRRSGRRRHGHRRALAVAIVIVGPVSGAAVNPAQRSRR